jgi:hypothetical protein
VDGVVANRYRAEALDYARLFPVVRGRPRRVAGCRDGEPVRSGVARRRARAARACAGGIARTDRDIPRGSVMALTVAHGPAAGQLLHLNREGAAAGHPRRPLLIW